jgi:hypothetical protein
VPSKIRPTDWDRLFAPNAPRRGGPLRALANVLIALVIVVLLGAGTIYAIRFQAKRVADQIATATAIAPTLQALNATATATILSGTATREAQGTATAVARQPPATALGVGVVANGGNLRKEPRVAPDTVIGLIWPGDEIAFLEESLVGGQSWFRIRVTKPATNRGGQGVEAGTDGWASASLLSPPTPVPTP